MSARLDPERREHLLRVAHAAGALDARDATAPLLLTKRWRLLTIAVPELADVDDDTDRTLLLCALEEGFRESGGYWRAARPVAAAVHIDAGMALGQCANDDEDTLVDMPRPIVKAKDRRYVYGPAKAKPLWRRLLGLACLTFAIGCGGEIGPADVTGEAADSTDAAPAPCAAPSVALCQPIRFGYRCFPVVADAETLCSSAAGEVWCCTEDLGDQ